MKVWNAIYGIISILIGFVLLYESYQVLEVGKNVESLGVKIEEGRLYVGFIVSSINIIIGICFLVKLNITSKDTDTNISSIVIIIGVLAFFLSLLGPAIFADLLYCSCWLLVGMTTAGVSIYKNNKKSVDTKSHVNSLQPVYKTKCCPFCKNEVFENSLFCGSCGKELPKEKACPHCGATVSQNDAFCQNCGKKIDEASVPERVEPSIKKCPHCGAVVNEEDAFCEYCGGRIREFTNNNGVVNAAPALETQPVPVPTPIVEEQPIPAPMPNPAFSQAPPMQSKPKTNTGILIGVIALLALAICGVGGYFYYNNVYLPAKIDREAPRYYTIANAVVLRSSRSAGADFNKVASLPYGTELITYEHDKEWSRVKVNSQNGEKQEGYVASTYILEKSDFFLMNSIFGNQDSKEAISTTKCRMALLDYFKERGYIGKIDEQVRTEAGITTVPNSENQWQVFTKPKDVKPNSVFYKRLYDRNSQFTDFAVIITNASSGERKLLYFYFDEDETPHLLKALSAPESGYIKDIYLISNSYSDEKYLNVQYSN